MATQIKSDRKDARFDIIGNLPEDTIAEVFTHLTEFSDLRRLIIWQRVSKTWRGILHSPFTKVYHQVILHNHRLRALLPPLSYYDSNDSLFSYAVFRKAMRLDLAIRKGSFRSAEPDIYAACGDFIENERYGAVDGGPFFSDGFLVWLERKSNLRTGGRTILLKVLDFSLVATKRRAPARDGPVEAKEVEGTIIAQFERPGESEYHLEVMFRTTMNHWIALGYGSGIAAYWCFLEYVMRPYPGPYDCGSIIDVGGKKSSNHITVLGLHKSNKFRWELPLSSLLMPPDGGKLYVRELFCSKDYLVVSISRSATFQVFSMSTRKRVHLLNLRNSSPYNEETTEFFYGTVDSGNCEYAAGIVDNRYFIYVVALKIFPPLNYHEPPRELRFASWDLGSSPTESGSRYYRSDQTEEAESGESGTLEPFFNIPLDPLASPNASVSSLEIPRPPKYDPPLSFLRPMRRVHIMLEWKGQPFLSTTKLKLQTTTRQILFYCPQGSHPPHVYYRFSYFTPPTHLKVEQTPWCNHCLPKPYPSLRRGFTPTLRYDDCIFGKIELRYNTEVLFTDQARRYRFALPPVSVLRGGNSFTRKLSGVKGHRFRLQMLKPTLPATPEMAKKASRKEDLWNELKKHWDVYLGPRIGSDWNASSRIWVEGGWVGVVVFSNGKLALWRWEDFEEEENQVWSPTTNPRCKGPEWVTRLLARFLGPSNA